MKLRVGACVASVNAYLFILIFMCVRVCDNVYSLGYIYMCIYICTELCSLSIFSLSS